MPRTTLAKKPQKHAKKKPQWCVYILRCADGTLYTGITNDLTRRLAQHNAGTAAKYTRTRGPVTVAHTERAKNKSLALKREYAIKQLSRNQKELLIAHGPSPRRKRAS
jgi:predicted GIY-YIG superfamily endonuclease